MATSKFEFLLNAMERASWEKNPARRGYGAKRRAVLTHVRKLEKERDTLLEQRERTATAIAEVRKMVEGLGPLIRFMLRVSNASRKEKSR